MKNEEGRMGDSVGVLVCGGALIARSDEFSRGSRDTVTHFLIDLTF